MKIAMVGTEFVKLSLAFLSAYQPKIYGLDFNTKKVELLEQKKSQMYRKKISVCFVNSSRNLRLSLVKKEANKVVELIVDTNSIDDFAKRSFMTSSMETKVSDLITKNLETLNNLIHRIVRLNTMRKKFITGRILKREPKNSEFYRLLKKQDSDRLRVVAV